MSHAIAISATLKINQMMPTSFAEENCWFKHPADLDKSQVHSLPGYRGQINGGNLDGISLAVVCWSFTAKEMEELQRNGGVIYVAMLGGLAPHSIGTSFASVSQSLDT